MSSDVVLVERDGPVATITLNRPEAANALDRALLGALRDAVASLAADDDVRAVVIGGAGDKAFCAGADLKERAKMTPDEVRAAVSEIRSTLDLVARVPHATIAAVNGVALGGGTELALACDLRIASSSASMGLTETSLAIVPGGGGTQRLPRLVGMGRAKELIFTARRIDADEAYRIGLVEEVCEPDVLRARAAEIASAIAANGPIAVRAAKQAITQGIELPMERALALEGEMYERVVDTRDRLEGLAAFREKRKPVYRGE